MGFNRRVHASVFVAYVKFRGVRGGKGGVWKAREGGCASTSFPALERPGSELRGDGGRGKGWGGGRGPIVCARNIACGICIGPGRASTAHPGTCTRRGLEAGMVCLCACVRARAHTHTHTRTSTHTLTHTKLFALNARANSAVGVGVGRNVGEARKDESVCVCAAGGGW